MGDPWAGTAPAPNEAPVEPGGSVKLRGQGAEIVRPTSDIPAARALGESVVPPNPGEALHQQRRALFDTAGEGAAQLLEGFVDTVSLGLIHDPSEAGQFAADVH